MEGEQLVLFDLTPYTLKLPKAEYREPEIESVLMLPKLEYEQLELNLFPE
jgi:hypothetical protein